MRLTTSALIGFFASLTGADNLHSAGAKASATATIVSPVLVSAAVYFPPEVLFSTSTGVLTIRIPGAPARVASVVPSCGVAGGAGNGCTTPTTLQLVRDGTLRGEQDVSISLIQRNDTDSVVTAILAYN